MEKFHDRKQAGSALATLLSKYANNKNVIVLALPRGGVPVAHEISETLHVPLDVFIVRKLGVPGYEELAMGAIASGGVTVFNENVLNDLVILKEDFDRVIKKEEIELKRREAEYRGDLPFPNVKNKIIILVDDGIATGATMRAAIKALRLLKPKNIIVAVPVAEKSMCDQITTIADILVCPLRPDIFYAVGHWYEEFPQTTDSEVHQLLAR
jgi:predicted phosphoribosyltransferase